MKFQTVCPLCHGTGGRCVGVTLGPLNPTEQLEQWKAIQDAKCSTCKGKGTVIATLEAGSEKESGNCKGCGWTECQCNRPRNISAAYLECSDCGATKYPHDGGIRIVNGKYESANNSEGI